MEFASIGCRIQARSEASHLNPVSDADGAIAIGTRCHISFKASGESDGASSVGGRQRIGARIDNLARDGLIAKVDSRAGCGSAGCDGEGDDDDLARASGEGLAGWQSESEAEAALRRLAGVGVERSSSSTAA